MIETIPINSNGPLACTIRVDQTGPMQLTFRAGSYTDTDGNTLDLLADSMADIPLDAVHNRALSARIGRRASDGSVDILVEALPLDGVSMSEFRDVQAPGGWQTGVNKGAFQVVWELIPFGLTVIPAGTADLGGVPIKILVIING